MVPSLHYAASSLMSTLYHRSGHVAVRWYLGDHALGLYAAAVRLADVLRGFLSITQSVLMPRMALRASSADGLPRLTRIAASVLVCFGVPLARGGALCVLALSARSARRSEESSAGRYPDRKSVHGSCLMVCASKAPSPLSADRGRVRGLCNQLGRHRQETSEKRGRRYYMTPGRR